MIDPFTGSGPGPQTQDGCSVEMYRQLPYLGELNELLPLLPTTGTALELGCGTGRLSRRLAQAGLQVTGVDDSPEMLAALGPGVTGVLSSIEALHLPRRFDVVLLASHLINHGDPAARAAFAACAWRHLQPGGRCFVQRHDPQWLCNAEPGFAGHAGPIGIHVERVAREGGAVRMTLRYELEPPATGQAPGAVWRQSFTAVPLEEDAVEAQLCGAGFTHFAWQGPRRQWVSAA